MVIRTTLRIYGVDGIPGTDVRLEIRPYYSPSGPEVLLASRIVRLHLPATPPDFARLIYPACAQIDMQQEFPFELLLGASFSITIVPLPFDSGDVPRIWAFVSTTDNATQEVAIQQPQ